MPQAKSSSTCLAQPKIPEVKLRLIHVARRQLGLSEADYRAILALHAGVESATELDASGFTAVMLRFEQLGFRSTSRRRPLAQRAGMASPGQTSLIRQLWAECTSGEGSDSSLGKWLESRFGVSSIRFVTSDLAPKVIGGMKGMKSKLKAKSAP